MHNVTEITENLHSLEEFDNIVVCSSYQKEYKKLFKKDVSAAYDYQKWLHRQLGILNKSSDPETLVRDYEAFEKIKQYEGFSLYAIRRPHSKGNPRVLFSAFVEEKDRLYILLLAFKELNTSDYTRNIPVAENRMKNILQSIKEEKP